LYPLLIISNIKFQIDIIMMAAQKMPQIKDQDLWEEEE
jgi:hypothetical protein